eukprot:gene973-1863_t
MATRDNKAAMVALLSLLAISGRDGSGNTATYTLSKQKESTLRGEQFLQPAGWDS